MDAPIAAPRKGGRPKGLPRTGGRQKGTPNHATAEVKSLARFYGADVIKRLAEIALKSPNEPSAIAACRELLERGYGRAVTMLSGPDEGPIKMETTVGLDTSKLSLDQLRALASIEL